MNIKKTQIISILTTIFIPTISFAADLSNLKGLISAVGNILSSLIPILFGLAIVYFFWGVGQFILKDAGSDKAREGAKNKILWGIIAIFVMVSIWGIVVFMANIFGIKIEYTQGVLPSRTIQQNLDLTLPAGGGGIAN